MTTAPFFYLIFFVSKTPVVKLMDFLMDGACYINKTTPAADKQYVIEKARNYEKLCIVYNALNQTYLNDPRHKNYDYELIRMLANWGKKYIVAANANANTNANARRKTPFGLETILEEIDDC